jgi:hypothetical protein
MSSGPLGAAVESRALGTPIRSTPNLGLAEVTP